MSIWELSSQGPARAALFGSVPAGSPAGAAVTVSLNATDGSYSKTFSTAAMADGTWKVLLDARPGGGDYAARADCASCAGGGASSNTLRDVTFGDVWYCSGQSNSSCIQRPLAIAAAVAVVVSGRLLRLRPRLRFPAMVAAAAAAATVAAAAADAAAAATRAHRRPR